MEKTKMKWPYRVLLSFCGFLLGGLYIALYFGGSAFLYVRMLSSMKEKTALLLFALLSLLGIVLFFFLARLVDKGIKAGRYAFPIGAFLASDGALVSIFVFKLLDVQKVLDFAGGNTALAKSYLYGMMVLIAALTVQVVCWLISVMFSAFRYFQKINFGEPGAVNTKTEAQLRAEIEAQLRAEQMKQTEQASKEDTDA